jgi:putative ABC transport system permease protein
MLKNYLKTALRNITKNKTFSFINILGFAFGMSICLMIVLYLMKEYSFDSYHTNAASIYRMVDAVDNYSTIDYRVKQAVTDNFPQVKKASIVNNISRPVEIKYNGIGQYIENIMSTDNDFFEMFTVQFVSGNPRKPFQNLNSVILSENAARLLFGNENPLGKEIVLQVSIRPQNQILVAGVFKDFPDNSSFKPNIIVNAENKDFKFYFSCENYSDVSTHRWLFNIYLQLNKNADPNQLVADINNRAQLLAPYEKKVSLLPLTEMYLNDDSKGGNVIKGNPKLLNLFLCIALIVLVLAVINYVNLTVARQNKRNKETGIRKTIGANRKDLIFLFLIESVLVTVIAFGIALIILVLGLPIFNGIVESSLSIRPLTEFPTSIILTLSILLVGVLAGMGPAVLLSSFNPVKIFNGGAFSKRRKSIFRNVLTVFQFTVSIGLIFCIIVIKKQLDFVKNLNPGFSKEQLLRIDMPQIQNDDRSKAMLLLDKFKQYPGIKNLSITMGVPGSITMKMGSAIAGKDKSLSIIMADTSFLKTFEIKQIMGRPLLPGDMGNVCMLNEAAYKYFEWTDLKDKRYNNGKPGGYEVIGVVKNFNYASLHNPVEPLCIIFVLSVPSQLNIKIAKGNVANTMEYIQQVWKEIIPSYPLKYQFYDDWFDAMYRKEDRLAKTISMFALLAISISCLGILGLAIFSSESRSKEIGIRKVHGANIKDLMLLLNIDYIKWVVIAFVIACPVAWYIMDSWLEDFSYRTTISWWVFALSGGIALMIALLTVSYHAIKSATANPIESLRYE